MGFFITGTDTGVGKTVVSAWICLHTRYAYWKPVQTGSLEDTDTAFVKKIGVQCYREAYCFQAPLSPHTAASLENQTIELSQIERLRPNDPHLVVEGAGGVLVPLNEHTLMIDLMKRLKLRVIVVARSGLGTLNHTLLTLEAIRARGMEPLGLILNGPLDPNNRDTLIKLGKTKVLAEIEPMPACTQEALQALKLNKEI